MKKYLLFLSVLISLAGNAQQLPPFQHTGDNRVLTDRATQAKFFLALPSADAFKIPGYVPDSIKAKGVWIKTGAQRGLYIFNPATGFLEQVGYGYTKAQIDSIAALKANKAGGNSFTGGFNNFSGGVGADNIYLTSQARTLVPGETATGFTSIIASQNNGPFLGIEIDRAKKPTFRFGEAAGGGSFVVQKNIGVGSENWVNVLKTDSLNAAYAKLNGGNTFTGAQNFNDGYNIGAVNVSTGDGGFNIQGAGKIALFNSTGTQQNGIQTVDNGDLRFGPLLTGNFSLVKKTDGKLYDYNEGVPIRYALTTDLTTAGAGYAKLAGGNDLFGVQILRNQAAFLDGFYTGGLSEFYDNLQINSGKFIRFGGNSTAGNDAYIANTFDITQPGLRIRSQGIYLDVLGANIVDNMGVYFAKTTDITAAGTTYLSKSGGTLTGDLILPSITPTNALSAAPKGYIDNLLTGISWKNAVRVKTTGNITLSGTQTVDGVALVAGNRVLVGSQTAPAENGLYLVAAGAWSRVVDADQSSELEQATVLVTVGAANKNTQWTYIGVASPVIGTDPIYFGQISGAGTYTNGTYLTLSGNVFDANLTNFDARYKATTLAGYGITDAYTKTQTDARYQTPQTTLSGYGITDAYTKTASDARYQTPQTTLSGYGIADSYTKTASDARYVDLTSAQTIGGSKTWSGNSNVVGKLGIGFSTAVSSLLQINPTTYTTTSAFSAGGMAIQVASTTYNSTAVTGTPSFASINSLGGAILTSSTNQTIANAANLYISGPPTASNSGGGPVIITNPYSLYAATGTGYFGAGLMVGGGQAAGTNRLTIGNATLAASQLYLTGGQSTGSSFSTTTAYGINQQNGIYNNTGATASPAATAVNYIGQPQLTATNTQTITDGATWFFEGPPTAGTGVAITNPYTIYVKTGNVYLGQGLIVNNALFTLNTTNYSTGGYSSLVRNISSGRYETIDLTAFNATTTALSSAILNSTYPSAPLGFRVICGNITAGGAIYVKYATSTWLMTSAPVAM